jgi:hypothetical protein
MKWIWASAVHYDYKSHAIPEPLVDGVLDNLSSRGCRGMNTETIPDDGISFDLPGVISVDRNMHDIQITGLKISIPSTDVATFFSMLNSLEERNEIGTKYYKLHGFHRCICLTPELKDELVEALKAVLPEAMAIADVENEEFNKKLCGPEARVKNLLVKPRPVRTKKYKA